MVLQKGSDGGHESNEDDKSGLKFEIKKFKTLNLKNGDDVANVDEGTFLIPTAKNQEIVDFVISRRLLIQVTLGAKHPYVKNDLKTLLKSWNWIDVSQQESKMYQGIDFVYALPEERFKNFAFQTPLTVKGTVLKKKGINPRQIAIKLDFKEMAKIHKEYILKRLAKEDPEMQEDVEEEE